METPPPCPSLLWGTLGYTAKDHQRGNVSPPLLPPGAWTVTSPSSYNRRQRPSGPPEVTLPFPRMLRTAVSLTVLRLRGEASFSPSPLFLLFLSAPPPHPRTSPSRSKPEAIQAGLSPGAGRRAAALRGRGSERVPCRKPGRRPTASRNPPRRSDYSPSQTKPADPRRPCNTHSLIASVSFLITKKTAHIK